MDTFHAVPLTYKSALKLVSLKDYWKILKNLHSGVFDPTKGPEKYSKKIHCTKMFVRSHTDFRENKLPIKEFIFIKRSWKIFEQNCFL